MNSNELMGLTEDVFMNQLRSTRMVLKRRYVFGVGVLIYISLFF